MLCEREALELNLGRFHLDQSQNSTAGAHGDAGLTCGARLDIFV